MSTGTPYSCAVLHCNMFLPLSWMKFIFKQLTHMQDFRVLPWHWRRFKTWNVKSRWLVVMRFTWHNVPEDFNLNLAPSTSWLLCKYLQIFLQGLCVMFLLYVNHISCSRQTHRYNLQVVERYYYMLSFVCAISIMYKTYNLHVWKWKFIVCNWWLLWSECTFCYREQMYFV